MATHRRDGKRGNVKNSKSLAIVASQAKWMEPLEERVLFSQPPLTVQPPTAYVASAPDVLSAGGTTVDVNVQYSDSAQFNFNSFAANNINVTGPGSVALTPLTFTTSASSTNNFVDIDYIFTAPNGAWDASANGTYTITSSSTHAVTDANTQAVPLLTLGSFRAFIGQNNPGFSSGTVTNGFSTQAITQLGDGSYIAVGSQPDGSGTQGKTQLAVQKYGGNGGADYTFGGADGKVALQFGTSSVGYGVAVQGDGNLVVAGSATNSGTGASEFTVFRLGSNGLPDPTFGQDLNGDSAPDGIETIDVGGANPVAYADALQIDGGIIAVGTTSTTGGGNFVIARVNPGTGLLDTGFGTNGFTTTSFGSDSAAGAVLIQPDNNILVAGNSGNNVVLARYTPAGLLDTSFGTNGTMVVPNMVANNWNVGLALQPNGQILVAAGDSTGTHFAVTRLSTTGAVDSTFGASGIAVVNAGSGVATSILIQAGGQIDLGGVVNASAQFSSAIATLTSAGQPQNNFNGGDTSTFSPTSSGGLSARSAMAPAQGGVVFAQTVGSGTNQVNSGATQLDDHFTDGIAPTAQLTPTTITAPTATATFTVTYADNVAVDPSTVAAGNVAVSDAHETLQVTAASPSLQSPGTPLTVTYTVAAPNGQFSAADNGSYTVALLAQVKDTAGNAVVADGNLGALTVNESSSPAPIPALTATNLTTSSAPTYSFSVAYTDALGINVATVGTGNVTVTGPNGALVVTSAVVDTATNGSPRTVTYTIAAPHDVFSTADNGTYTIGITNTLQDVSGNPTAVNSSLGTFTVLVTNPPRTPLGSFGTVTGSKKSQKLTVSVNGVPTVFTVTNGSGQAFLNGSDVDLTVTATTGKKAAVKVAPKGGRITLGDVSITGNVSTFTAPTSDLVGTFYISGAAGTVTLGNMTNATFDAAFTLGSIKAISLTDSKLLDGVGAGADDTVGTSDDVFGTGVINKITIAGAVNASVIAAGANPVNGTFGDGDDILAGGGSIIKTLAAKGGTTGATVFESGAFKSASLPKKIKVISSDSRFRILT